ncbi:hypothetical protein [Streptacidiphilus sp. MAP5-3]|uniref:hypothetical protein n=1 Tax=unclassified Streptacidiphilus TaxID=2643834 RepID=UPI0035188C0E
MSSDTNSPGRFGRPRVVGLLFRADCEQADRRHAGQRHPLAALVGDFEAKSAELEGLAM